jgi:hypothetical protein
MDWLKFIRQAYTAKDDDYGSQPIFYPSASEEEILEVERNLGFLLPQYLRELLSQTNGLGEEMVFGDARTPVELGNFFLNTKEIVEFTKYYRQSGLSANIDFNEVIFFGNMHVDGIYLAIRRTENTIYAWYPIELEFRAIASNMFDLITGWLSGKLAI